MSGLVNFSQSWLEKGWIPDPVIRIGMRRLLADKLAAEYKSGEDEILKNKARFVSELKNGPIAVNTLEANEQHYEVPTEFFKLVLGRHMKYSSAHFDEGVDDLDSAEEAMLKLTAGRADIQNGQDILELGCGWGSLTLYMAEKCPRSRITGVSNSRTQREYIEAEAQRRGLANIRIITADINTFILNDKFDRAVSVEMFEHMRNYERLLAKIAGFLNPEGKLFVHIFTHKKFAYYYDAHDANDWIAKYFFTGGIMPSDDLLYYFQNHFCMEEHWQVNGRHYQLTAEAWLENMDRNRDQIVPILRSVYGSDDRRWWNYWRIFFMACAELWGYRRGNEWMVSHYRLVKKLT